MKLLIKNFVYVIFVNNGFIKNVYQILKILNLKYVKIVCYLRILQESILTMKSYNSVYCNFLIMLKNMGYLYINIYRFLNF